MSANTNSGTESPYARARHARYIEPGIVYHVLARTRAGLFLLRPDLEGELRAIVAGILAQAQKNWGGIANYGTSILSNHLHSLLSAIAGDPRNLSSYVGFLEREITRRWKHHVGWSGSIFEGFECTAIITPRGQTRALKYVLSQGVKEDLIEDPCNWPGFHCAQPLTTGKPVEGYWFDGTGYGRECYQKRRKDPRAVVDRRAHTTRKTFRFDKLPALAHLDDEAYRREMTKAVDEVIDECRSARQRPVLGVQGICATDPMTRREVPPPPWFETRRRFIAWDDPADDQVKEYKERYWAFQVDFRTKARSWQKAGCDASAFPQYSYIPGRRSRPIAHMETAGT